MVLSDDFIDRSGSHAGGKWLGVSCHDVVYNLRMRVVVLSDVHCSGLNDPIQHEFVQWLDSLEADALWMLGDIFHWGWNFGNGVQSSVQPVVDALSRAQERGTELLFVGGNHDFAVGKALEGALQIEVRGAHVREISGRQVFLAHGDEADQTFGYRLTQWFLRGPLFGWAMNILGEERGTWVLLKLAGNQKTDLFQVADRRARDWLQTQLVDGTTLAMCGHFHLASRESHESGEVVTLGAGGGRAAVWLVDGDLL
jgi:UDP-2,3-diacylglucosamine pyrophosphatase LpxH